MMAGSFPYTNDSGARRIHRMPRMVLGLLILIASWHQWHVFFSIQPTSPPRSLPSTTDLIQETKDSDCDPSSEGCLIYNPGAASASAVGRARNGPTRINKSHGFDGHLSAHPRSMRYRSSTVQSDSVFEHQRREREFMECMEHANYQIQDSSVAELYWKGIISMKQEGAPYAGEEIPPAFASLTLAPKVVPHHVARDTQQDGERLFHANFITKRLGSNERNQLAKRWWWYCHYSNNEQVDDIIRFFPSNSTVQMRISPAELVRQGCPHGHTITILCPQHHSSNDETTVNVRSSLIGISIRRRSRHTRETDQSFPIEYDFYYNVHYHAQCEWTYREQRQNSLLDFKGTKKDDHISVQVTEEEGITIEQKRNNHQKIVSCLLLRDSLPRNRLPQFVEYHRMIGVRHFLVHVAEPSLYLLHNSSFLYHVPYVSYIPFDIRHPLSMSLLWNYDEANSNTTNTSIGSYVDEVNFLLAWQQQAQQMDCLHRSRDVGATWAIMTDVDEYIVVQNSSSHMNETKGRRESLLPLALKQVYEQSSMYEDVASIRLRHVRMDDPYWRWRRRKPTSSDDGASMKTVLNTKDNDKMMPSIFNISLSSNLQNRHQPLMIDVVYQIGFEDSDIVDRSGSSDLLYSSTMNHNGRHLPRRTTPKTGPAAADVGRRKQIVNTNNVWYFSVHTITDGQGQQLVPSTYKGDNVTLDIYHYFGGRTSVPLKDAVRYKMDKSSDFRDIFRDELVERLRKVGMFDPLLQQEVWIAATLLTSSPGCIEHSVDQNLLRIQMIQFATAFVIYHHMSERHRHFKIRFCVQSDNHRRSAGETLLLQTTELRNFLRESNSASLDSTMVEQCPFPQPNVIHVPTFIGTANDESSLEIRDASSLELDCSNEIIPELQHQRQGHLHGTGGNFPCLNTFDLALTAHSQENPSSLSKQLNACETHHIVRMEEYQRQYIDYQSDIHPTLRAMWHPNESLPASVQDMIIQLADSIIQPSKQ